MPVRPPAYHPIFRSPDATWYIDRCAPQRAAIDAGDIQFAGVSHGHYPGDRLPEDVLPGVCNLGHWTAATPQTWGEEPHRNEGVEICYLQSGSLWLSAAGRWHRLKAGALTIVQPWQLHHFGRPSIAISRLHWLLLDTCVRRPNQPWRWPDWVILSAADKEEFSARVRGMNTPLCRANASVRDAFLSLAQAVACEAPLGMTSEVAVGINQLLLGVLHVLRDEGRSPLSSSDAAEQTVRLFYSDLEQHADALAEPWQVADMAQECGLGVSRFNALTRACFGVTPMVWLRDARVALSKQYLKEPSLTITQVAHRCGFSSSQYFATSFKRVERITPRQWRRGSRMGSIVQA